MSVSKVSVNEGCTLCALCEQICPEGFKMGDTTAEVIPGVNLTENESKIREAADSCPVSVIAVAE